MKEKTNNEEAQDSRFIQKLSQNLKLNPKTKPWSLTLKKRKLKKKLRKKTKNEDALRFELQNLVFRFSWTTT